MNSSYLPLPVSLTVMSGILAVAIGASVRADRRERRELPTLDGRDQPDAQPREEAFRGQRR